MTYLNEFFALPSDLKVVATVENGKIYGSKKLAEKYIEVIRELPLTKNISNEIEKMVREKRIIPCFANRGIITFLIHRFSFYNHSFEKVAGFYLPDRNKIFIFIDHSMNFLFMGSDDFMGRVTIHELIHMCSVNRSKYFWKLFKEDLIKFYSTYYKKLYKLKNEDGKINHIVLKLLNIFYLTYEKGSSISLSEVFATLQEFKEISELESDVFNRLTHKYCIAISIFSTDNANFLNQYSNFLDVITPIKETYDELYGNINGVIFYQEMATPSEVICISSEVEITDKIRLAVRSII